MSIMEPVKIILPSCMTPRWSAIWSMSLSMCVATTMVLVLASSRMKSNVKRLAEGSRPAVGSSHMSKGGSPTSDAAIPSRVHIPVENVPIR